MCRQRLFDHAILTFYRGGQDRFALRVLVTSVRCVYRCENDVGFQKHMQVSHGNQDLRRYDKNFVVFDVGDISTFSLGLPPHRRTPSDNKSYCFGTFTGVCFLFSRIFDLDYQILLWLVHLATLLPISFMRSGPSYRYLFATLTVNATQPKRVCSLTSPAKTRFLSHFKPRPVPRRRIPERPRQMPGFGCHAFISPTETEAKASEAAVNVFWRA